jgi:hypothetical protein
MVLCFLEGVSAKREIQDLRKVLEPSVEALVILACSEQVVDRSF